MSDTKREEGEELSSDEQEESSEEETSDIDDSGTSIKGQGTKRENKEEDDGNEGYNNLRKELGEVPLGELQKLKTSVGLKRYNEVLFGTHLKSGDKEGGTEDEEDEPDEITAKKKVKTTKLLEKGKKSEPEEMSSKNKPKKRKPRNVVTVVNRKSRDPRFDDLSGELNMEMFERSYKFVDEMKKAEKQKISKALGKEKNPQRKDELQKFSSRMEEDEKRKVSIAEKRKRDKVWKSSQTTSVINGKKAYFLKKSDRRKLELAEKFRALKSSGQLDSYLAKKRKRNAAKERKRLPENLSAGRTT